jgi:hypothetical protein
MKINGTEIVGKQFAYDNCHKIYIIEDNEDLDMANEYGYDIFDITELENTYNNSCPLRFISNWKLDKQYVKQCESNVEFEVL